MAYDKTTTKVISVPISITAYNVLVEIARKQKRSIAAQGGYLLEQTILNYEKQG